MMAIRSRLPAGKRPSFPQQGGQVSQQGHPQSQGSGQSQGGQGQQGHLHKGQGQGHGQQGQQKSKGAFEGPQRALTAQISQVGNAHEVLRLSPQPTVQA